MTDRDPVEEAADIMSGNFPGDYKGVAVDGKVVKQATETKPTDGEVLMVPAGESALYFEESSLGGFRSSRR